MASRSNITDLELSRLFTNVESGMVERFSDTHRRVWVQYCRVGKEKINVLVTMFPTHGEYTMFSVHGKNVNTLTTDSLLDELISISLN